MTTFGGKKTAKMHVRMSEDLACEVRALADLEHRPFMDQIRLLIVIGLQIVRQGNRGEIRRTVTPDVAQQELPMPQTAARRRVVTRREIA